MLARVLLLHLSRLLRVGWNGEIAELKDQAWYLLGERGQENVLSNGVIDSTSFEQADTVCRELMILGQVFGQAILTEVFTCTELAIDVSIDWTACFSLLNLPLYWLAGGEELSIALDLLEALHFFYTVHLVQSELEILDELFALRRLPILNF